MTPRACAREVRLQFSFTRCVFSLAVVIPLWVIAWGQVIGNPSGSVNAGDALKAYKKYEYLKQKHRSQREDLFDCLRGIPKEQASEAVAGKYKRLKDGARELQDMEARHAIAWGTMGLAFSPTADGDDVPSEESVAMFWRAENRVR